MVLTSPGEMLLCVPEHVLLTKCLLDALRQQENKPIVNRSAKREGNQQDFGNGP